MLEWECCVKSPEQGAAEGAPFIARHIIEATAGRLRRFRRRQDATRRRNRRIAGPGLTRSTGRNASWNRWKRKLRMGMVGGGEGAFIGAVHRIAATLDQQVELVAGCFSRDRGEHRRTGRAAVPRSGALLPELRGDGRDGEGLPPDTADRLRQHRHAEPHALPDRQDVSRSRVSRRLRQADDFSARRGRTSWCGSSRQTGLVFALTHNYTGHPLIRHARHLFRSGAMGTVRKVIVEYLQDFLMVPHEKLGQKQAAWRTRPGAVGASAARSATSARHCVNLLEYVTGDPDRRAVRRQEHVPARPRRSTRTSTCCCAFAAAARAC